MDEMVLMHAVYEPAQSSDGYERVQLDIDDTEWLTLREQLAGVEGRVALQ